MAVCMSACKWVVVIDNESINEYRYQSITGQGTGNIKPNNPSIFTRRYPITNAMADGQATSKEVQAIINEILSTFEESISSNLQALMTLP